MLKFVALAACVMGVAYLVPKAWAEFRRAGPRTRSRLKDTAEKRDAGEKPRPGVAA